MTPRGEPGPATTYKLPSASALPGHRAAPHRRPPAAAHRERPSAGNRRARTSLRAFVAGRPRAVALIAAAVLFLTAMYVGMAVFSPDSSSAETPREKGRSSPAVTPSR